ncbi:MAG: EAL domain-containing protein, partial [Pseudomonadota bacterium]
RGESDLWSEPTTNRTIKFASLPAGDYTFEVRARSAGNLWSQPTEWSLSVPAPFWQSPWFIAVAAIALVLLGRGILDFRVHQVEQSNQRLRAEVDARTHAIEQARQALQDSHNRLQEEVREREKSDALRADVEARFHQAYQNAPIGMALIGTDGMVFDANPQLKAMFWPESMPEEKEVLLDVVAEHEREPFVQFFFDFVADTSINPSKEIRCLSYTGETRQIAFSLSPVTNADGDLHYVLLMANDVTESRALTDQLRYQANYDELTGLLNRRAFAQRLKETIDQSRAPEQMPYLMFLDLDRFKVVNDTCGHAAGDDLLKLAAEAIVSCNREHDTVARLGGDEFALIVATNKESIAMQRAERVRRAIDSLEFYWESEVFRIGVSIGLVRISPAVSDIDEVQQLADAACYAAKESGRNRVHLVGDESDIVHERRGEMRWAHRLNYAINNDRFALFGQRITSLRPDTVDGDRFEILLRMKDQSTRKLIPPAAFLPAAERFGLQVRLDYWVVNRVTEMLKEDHHGKRSTLCGYWVNLSGASINDRGFCRDVTALIRHAQLPPGSLNFEITETTAIRQIDAAAQLIEDLRELGCLFALDDFGSGLSSFDYLKRLNVDYVKIDGQFVRDIAANKTDRIFVKSIVDIAHALGVKVVAEFVETEEALAIVTELGTDYAQGFGIHRPEQLIAAQTTNVYATSTSQQAI